MKGKNNNLNQYIIMQLEALQSYANKSSPDGNGFWFPWLAEFRTRGIQPINAVKLQLAKWYNLYDFPLPSIGNNLTYTFGTAARFQLTKLEIFESLEMDEDEKTMRLQAVRDLCFTTDSNSSQPRNHQRGFGQAYTNGISTSKSYPPTNSNKTNASLPFSNPSLPSISFNN